MTIQVPIRPSILIVQKLYYNCVLSCVSSGSIPVLKYGPLMCFQRSWYVHCFFNVHCQYTEMCLSGHATFFQMVENDTLFIRESFHLQRKFSLSYCICSVSCCRWLGWKKSVSNTATDRTFELAESITAIMTWLHISLSKWKKDGMLQEIN